MTATIRMIRHLLGSGISSKTFIFHWHPGWGIDPNQMFLASEKFQVFFFRTIFWMNIHFSLDHILIVGFNGKKPPLRFSMRNLEGVAWLQPTEPGFSWLGSFTPDENH